MVAAQTARVLVRAGARVDVLAEERCPEQPRHSLDEGVVVRRLACNRAEIFRAAPGLLRYLATHHGDYDVVHAHSYHAPVAVGAALALRAATAGSARPDGATFVLSPHYHGCGHSPLRAALHHLYRPLGRHALGFASRVVSVSHAEAALVERHFPNTAGRLAVIPNGVDAAAIRAARPLPGEPPTVLAIGRLASYKRLDVVIEGFERWAATGSRSTVRDSGNWTRSQRCWALALVGLSTFVPRYLRNPFAPSYHDEYAHWHEATDVLATGRLFQGNSLIPIVEYYPGTAPRRSPRPCSG